MMCQDRVTLAVTWPDAVFHAWIIVIVSAAIVVLEGGCGKAVDTRFIPVSGRITLDGQPLSQAQVVFCSKNDEVAALTDTDGRYQLNRGAIPDEYRVYITIVDVGQAELAMEPGAAGRGARGAKTPTARAHPKQTIPSRYGNPQQTELRFTVTSGSTKQADFSLLSK